MILQTIKIPIVSNLNLAEKYFAIMSVLNNWNLAKREIQLMAFAAVNGGIGSFKRKKEFIKEYNSSIATIGNIISRLSKTPLLNKDKRGSVVVNKALLSVFEEGLKMDITMEHVIK